MLKTKSCRMKSEETVGGGMEDGGRWNERHEKDG